MTIREVYVPVMVRVDEEGNVLGAEVDLSGCPEEWDRATWLVHGEPDDPDRDDAQDRWVDDRDAEGLAVGWLTANLPSDTAVIR